MANLPSLSQSNASKSRRKRATPSNKLPRLPSNAKVIKRPLHHPPIPSPNSGSTTQKVIYVSTRTPFMSAVSRIRSTLSQMQKRRTQSIFAESTKKNVRGDRVLAAAIAGAQREGGSGERGVDGDFVTVKGSGRCVEKVLGVAGFFQSNMEKEGCWVRLRTGSEWVVDDVVVEEDEERDKEEDEDEDEGEDIPESRVRHVSVLEVRVGLR